MTEVELWSIKTDGLEHPSRAIVAVIEALRGNAPRPSDAALANALVAARQGYENQVAQLKDQLADESLGGRTRPDYKDVDISRAYVNGYFQAVDDAIVADRCREVAKALAEKKERGSG